MLTPSQLAELRAFQPEGRNRVAKARELLGMTQSAFAEALNLTQPYISDLERSDYVDLPLERTRAIAAFVGCEIVDLFLAPPRQEAAAS